MAASLSAATALALSRYIASLMLAIAAVSSAAAEDVASDPSATIRIVVPYPSGAAGFARMIERAGLTFSNRPLFLPV
jgi:hypothetical protein